MDEKNIEKGAGRLADCATTEPKRDTILQQQRQRRSRLIQDLSTCEEVIKLLEGDSYLAMQLEKIREAIW